MSNSNIKEKMSKYFAMRGSVTLLVVVLILWGCGGPPESPPKPRVVVRKIPAQKIATPQAKKHPKAAVSQAKKGTAPPPKSDQLKAKKDAETSKPEKRWFASIPGTLQQLMAPASGKSSKEKSPKIVEGYDPKGKVDPFEPIFRTKPQEKATTPEKAKRKRRIPLTPLEKLSLDQLELVGIIRAPSGNRALVQEASGKGYIVKKGTYIGLHEGVVSDILKDRIRVRETVENYYGEVSVRNRELMIQKPPGEL